VFAQVVRRHRLRLGLTQEELARKTGLSVRTIRNIEAHTGRVPRMSSVRLLAHAFGLAGSEREDFCRATDRAGDPPPAGGAPHTAPAQLPADVAGFVGRRHELAQLDRLCAAATGPASGAAGVHITVISGTAGVGKTALAVHWSHQVADRFADGQLYVNLRGFEPAGQVASPAGVVRGFLNALGVPAARLPIDLDAQVGLYRTMLAGKRILVVLDNARDAEQVRPLLPASPSSVAIVTSRNRLTGLVATSGARTLTLDLLSATEARELLAHRLGAARVTAEPHAVEQIIIATARLPLALAVAAARADQTGFRLDEIAADLDDAGRRLDALDTDDPTSQVRAVFSWSYRALSPAAARLFRLLGLPRGPDLSATAAAALAGLPQPRLRPR
jgi:transcriptional regulator with XRE-family HTH domain